MITGFLISQSPNGVKMLFIIISARKSKFKKIYVLYKLFNFFISNFYCSVIYVQVLNKMRKV